MEKQKIFRLLQNYRLDKFYKKFLDLGVETEQDFLDSITDKTLDDMGFSQVEKNRFGELVKFIKGIGVAAACPVKNSSQTFKLYYTFLNCGEHKEISGMDPENSVEDLMLRICHQENIGPAMSVCLFTGDGMPLTDDPFFNTWSLKDRYIENGSKLFAIFTPKENLRDPPVCPEKSSITNEGPDTVRCHIMLKGDFEIKAALKEDTMVDLKGRLSLESGIPLHVLYPKDENHRKYSETLSDLGVSEDETVQFILSSFHDSSEYNSFHSDVKPSVPQSQKGLSLFFSTLYSLKMQHGGQKIVAYIRKVTGCNALAQSLHQIFKALNITKIQKVAIVEGLYFLFRALLPSPTRRHGDKIIEDGDVFEHSNVCWAYILSEGQGQTSEEENTSSYTYIHTIALSTQQRLSEPVRIIGTSAVYDRMYILDKIKNEENIPDCSEEKLKEELIQRATDVEKVLLSMPPHMTYFPVWKSYDAAHSACRFDIKAEKTYTQLNEELKKYPSINIAPPLQLKNLGAQSPQLVCLSGETVGVYIGKDKAAPSSQIKVFDSLSGKDVNVNVDELANQLRDTGADLTFQITKAPKEAIVVLFDSSSSMDEHCFDAQCQMKRIDAIKQVFDSFSNRSMAYDFNHVICLVKFDSQVKTLHTFTENLETFKEYIHGLQASGRTVLYDALNQGCEELVKVKEKFPDCRRRILCLTDGNDFGSACKSVDVAKKLIGLDIVVDSVIVGKVENTVLHGISNVTGGCCFKPETNKEAVQLFEMETVLSMDLRKEKKKFDAYSITKEEDLRSIFLTHPYDTKPETKLPPQINSKVTVTQNVLKKKIMESKSGRFLEKDKRILEELKSLHCDPHPFCTVLPSESDFCFWKILLQGPPDTPYEKGVFELYCEFGPEYPVKPPLMRFFTPIYHCNINSVGRICHNIFDRNYSAQITMREILDAVYGLLIAPEPEDPLDSVLAEEYMTSKEKYEEEAQKYTESNASASLDEAEKKYVPEMSQIFIPPNLLCPLTKKLFVDPVKTKEGCTYERNAIEKHLKIYPTDPQTKKRLRRTDLKEDRDIKRAVKEYRRTQIQETYV